MPREQRAWRLREIRALHRQEERERTGLFLAEGIRFLGQALDHRAAIETVIVAPRLLVNPTGQRLVRQARAAGMPVLEVTAESFAQIALAREAQGVALVARQRWESLGGVRPADELGWLAVETVRSPGNLGTMVRTAEAVGAAGLILLGDAADPYDPAAVRATMGALFAQRLVRTTAADLMAWRRRHGLMLVGTSPRAELDYQAVAYRPPTILLMGEERRGLTGGQQALCDVMVRMPMVGTSDSLNVAVATGVMLYELFNQRRKRSNEQ